MLRRARWGRRGVPGRRGVGGDAAGRGGLRGGGGAGSGPRTEALARTRGLGQQVSGAGKRPGAEGIFQGGRRPGARARGLPLYPHCFSPKAPPSDFSRASLGPGPLPFGVGGGLQD